MASNIPANPPAKRTIDMRSLDFGAAGPEQPYPVYQFSGYRTRWEFPEHNPFGPVALGPQDNQPPYHGGSGGILP